MVTPESSFSPAEQLQPAGLALLAKKLLEWLIPVALFLFVFAFLAWPYRTPLYEGAFQDDFFYYLEAAKHILAGQGSTFDGVHLTNGYHPLWMLVCITLLKQFSGKAVFVAFLALTMGLLVATYASLIACLRTFCPPLAAQAIAAYVTIAFAVIAGGMEITLALPLLFLLCQYRLTRFHWRPAQACVYGLLASAAVLARLDCALFVLLLGCFDLALSSDTPWSTRLRAVGPFVLGLLPVFAYLAWNLRTFGSALPISSHAKDLRVRGGLTATPLHSFLHQYQPQKSLLVWLFLAALPYVVGLLVWRGLGPIPRAYRGLTLALLLFAPLQLAVLSVSSDWPIWSWYLYPVLLFVFGAAIVIFSNTARSFWLAQAPCYLLAILAAVSIVRYDFLRRADLSSWHFQFVLSGLDLAAFAKTHPGIYAMGDRAGAVGYLLPMPLVQTEGLMMDKAYLENIRDQRELIATLRAYHVRYYVATNPVPQGSCVLTREPAQGGPDTPAMRGRLCSVPVHRFATADNSWRSYVFDLNREPGSQAAATEH